MRLPPAVLILALAAFLCAGYAIACRQFGLDAPLSESNLQANLSRINRYLYDDRIEHPVVLAGSSFSGRLLPAYFAEAGQPILNLGLDGSRPRFVFEVLQRRSSLPAVLLVETTHLFEPLTENDRYLREQIDSPGFHLSQTLTLLRPQHRPSSLLYSWLKLRRDERGDGIPLPAAASLEPPERTPVAPELVQMLARFQAAGVKIAFVEIPWRDGWGSPVRDSSFALARRLDLPFLQPGPRLAQRQATLQFSDGMHLMAASARLVATEIVSELREEGPQWHFKEP